MVKIIVDWSSISEDILKELIEESVEEILTLCKSKEKAYAYLLNLKLQPHAEVYYRSGQLILRRPPRRTIPTSNTQLELIMKRFLEDLGFTDYEFQYEVKGYILDFAFPDIKLAIEVGHVKWHPEERDKRKEKALLDWKILWFNVESPKELLEHEEEIKRSIMKEVERLRRN